MSRGTGRAWKVFYAGALLAFLATSAITLEEALRETAWTTFAQRLDASKAPNDPSPAVRRAVMERIDKGSRSCLYGADRSQVSLAIYVLRLALRPGSPLEDRASAVAVADGAIRRSLACHPADGSLWSTFAVIENLKGAKRDRLESLLAVSKARAPAEARVLAARSALIVRLMRNPAYRQNAAFIDDLSRTVRLVPLAEGVVLLEGLEAGGNKDLAAHLVAELPDDQRNKLLVLTGKSEPAPRGLDRFRNFDFDPFKKVMPAVDAVE